VRCSGTEGDPVKTASLIKYRARLSAESASYFDDWPITPAQRQACWQNLVQTVDALIALGPRGTAEGATEILRQCVERYNELDEGFICTLEREELCDILYEIGECCGPDSEDDWVDEWRDW
jgi:hypothetical protein